jgi:hypothetical protein
VAIEKEKISFEEIEQCLRRSGYLMESRMVSALSRAGYFVEPNQSIRDPRTGKSREIDLLAEYHNREAGHENVAVKTTLVIEAINNRYPFVLLTERPPTPGADFESYIKFIYTPEPNPFMDQLHLYDDLDTWTDLFSQYCGLTKKNSNAELLASHSDDVYASLLKMSEFVEEAIGRWLSHEEEHSYWRLFFWQPMLVLGGDLVTVTLDKNGIPKISEAQFGRLEFNWHSDDQPRTTVVEVVTENFLLQRLAAVQAKDAQLEGKIHEIHVQRKHHGVQGQ